MIELNTIQLMVIGLSLSTLIGQSFVAKKSYMHILFALFCGSVAIGYTQKVTGDYVGAWQYVIGMGAFATCNGYWLLSRALFRENKPFTITHWLMAGIVAALVMVKQGYLFADSFIHFSDSMSHLVTGMLNEVTRMASSCVLVAILWEGCRGFSQANKTGKAQRAVFLGVLISAIGGSKLAYVALGSQPEKVPLSISFITMTVIIFTQVLVFWISSTRRAAEATSSNVNLDHENISGEIGADNHERNSLAGHTTESEADKQLAETIEHYLLAEQQFLQSNLKVIDLAKVFDVPEYRISRVLRNQCGAKNFNNYVNQLRIEHARVLLSRPDTQHWSILVVAMESGFGSVGPFNRAFKQATGMTPGQYRASLTHSAPHVEASTTAA